ncbi:MAG: hypothetical protein HOD92_24605 [Deltaproteobacteria bacterium]|jgi:hypothetical protein|nr:hypothetical protein [Deltaproteobacteria bacterium]
MAMMQFYYRVVVNACDLYLKDPVRAKEVQSGSKDVKKVRKIKEFAALAKHNPIRHIIYLDLDDLDLLYTYL